MISIELDMPYTAYRFRSGASERGRWEVITVVDEAKKVRTMQEVTIFPANLPSGVKENEQFIIKRILKVTRKKAKDRDGNWSLVDVGITADVQPVKDELNLGGDLPFTMDAYNDDDDGEDIDISSPLGSSTPTDLL